MISETAEYREPRLRAGVVCIPKRDRSSSRVLLFSFEHAVGEEENGRIRRNEGARSWHCRETDGKVFVIVLRNGGLIIARAPRGRRELAAGQQGGAGD